MTSLASVFVEVRPDTSGFSADLKRNLAKTREAVDVAAKLDTSKLKPQLDALKADLRAVSVTKANITAESSQVSAQIRTLKLQLKDLNTKAKIEGDGGDFTSAIGVAKAELASLQDSKVRLSVDSAQASAHLKALNAQLGLFDRDRTVDVDVKGGGGLPALSGRLSEVGASMSGIMTKAGAVGPAILALGSAMSAAAAGGTQLIATLGPAAAGAGVFGLAVAGQVEEMKKAQEEIKKKNDAVSKAQTIEDGYRIALKSTTAGSAEYKAAQTALQAAHAKTVEATRQARVEQQGFNQAFGPAAAGLNKFKDAYQAFLGATGSVTVNVMGDALQLAAAVLPRLVPLANGAGRAIGGLVREFEGFTRGAQFANLLRFFEREGPAAITSFGHILGNLGVALGNIFAIGGSGGSGKALLGTVESLTVRFREWTGSANGAASIAKWFAQGRTNLAAMSGLVKDVFGGMKDIGSGRQLAPLINQVRREVIPPLMEFLNNASASGALGALVTAVGRVIGVFAKLAASDGSLKAFAVTLGALATAAGWIVDKVPGASTALGAFFTVAGGAAALKLVGIGNGLASLRTGFMLVATATGRATIAQNLNAASAKASAAATAVMAGVQKAAAIATTLWTGAVRLLNLAWRANPIGLVITGLTLLGAGLVLAYKKSETFRRIVDGAFAGVKKVAADVVGWFQRELVPFFTRAIPNAFQSVVGWVRRNWPVMLAILTGPIGLAVLAITKNRDKIETAFTGLKNWAVGTFKTAWAKVQGVFENPVEAARKGFLGLVGVGGKIRTIFLGVKDWAIGAFKTAWNKVQGVFEAPVEAARKGFVSLLGANGKVRTTFSNVKDWAVGTFRSAWAKVQGVFENPVEAARKGFVGLLGANGKVRTTFNNVKDWAIGTFSRAWNKVTGVFTDPIVAVRKAFDRILGPDGPVRTLFSNTVKRLGDIWEGLQKKAKDPVRFVVNTVFAGMVRTLNKIPGVNIPVPDVKFAQGGVMPGYTPGRDVHQFYSPTAGRLALSGGEAIMRPEWTKAVGGEKGVKRLNEEARRGIFHGGFAAGGIFRPVRGGSSSLNIHGSPPAIDIGVPVGQAVYAARSGRVSTSTDLRGREPRAPHGGLGYRSYGRYITINSGGIQTLYAHLSARSALAGQMVSGGQRIGFSGNTGNSRGPHLHFGASDGPTKYYRATPGSGGDRRGGSPGGSGNPAGFYDVVRKYPDFRNPIPGILSSIGGWSKRVSGMGEWGKALAGVPGKLFGKISATGGFIFKKIQGALTAVKRVWTAISSGGAGKSLNEVTGKLVPAMKRAYEFAQNTLGIRTIYGYSYRPNTANPSQLSDHAYGKALDLMGAKQNVADYFAFGEGRRRFNIENVIYNRRITNPGRGWRWGAYTGPNPHTDHVHIDTFDRGGIFPSGTLARNISGQPERVLDPRTTRNFERLTTALDRMDRNSTPTASTRASSPLIGSAVIRETVDLERYEKQRAFRERMTNVGG